MRGGVVAANNSLDLDVGGNLVVESLQDKSSSSSYSYGVNGGYSETRDKDNNKTGSGNGGANFSVSMSERKWVTEQTSLTGSHVNIYVEKKTALTGAVIASTSNDLTLDTGSLEYSDIKDKDISWNGGLTGSYGKSYVTKTDGDNNDGDKSNSAKYNTWSASLTYGYSEKRQTNFATIGEGTIIVRDGETDLSGLNRDVTKAQYGTVDIGLKGGFTVDSSTVALVTSPIKTIKKTHEALEKGYNGAKKTSTDIYAQSIVLYEKAGEIIGRNLFYNDRDIQIKECIGRWSDKTESGMGWLIVKRIIYDHDNNNGAGRYGEGLHIVMLENSTVEPYLVKGLDEFNAKCYIIENGKIQYSNVGTSKASITPGYSDWRGYASDKNAGNNILPGDYKVHGEFYSGQFNKLKVLNADGSKLLPSTGPNGTQDQINIHAPMFANTWSGSLGCPTIIGFQDYSTNRAVSNGGKVMIEGSYHLVDMSIYTK